MIKNIINYIYQRRWSLQQDYKDKDTRLWIFSAAQRYFKENLVNPDIAISQGLLYSL